VAPLVEAPAFEEILAVRAERQQLVPDSLATATAELLAENARTPGAVVTGAPVSVTASE
jgi:hypothetical protein